MDYNPLSLYLEKFKNILLKTSLDKDTIISIISNEIKNETKTEDIKIKNTNIILINMSPIKRNEIYLHKEKILKQLKEKGLNITNIN